MKSAKELAIEQGLAIGAKVQYCFGTAYANIATVVEITEDGFIYDQDPSSVIPFDFWYPENLAPAPVPTVEQFRTYCENAGIIVSDILRVPTGFHCYSGYKVPESARERFTQVTYAAHTGASVLRLSDADLFNDVITKGFFTSPTLPVRHKIMPVSTYNEACKSYAMKFCGTNGAPYKKGFVVIKGSEKIYCPTLAAAEHEAQIVSLPAAWDANNYAAATGNE